MYPIFVLIIQKPLFKYFYPSVAIPVLVLILRNLLFKLKYLSYYYARRIFLQLFTQNWKNLWADLPSA